MVVALLLAQLLPGQAAKSPAPAEAKKSQPPALAASPKVQTDAGGLAYVWMPPGTFMMGCSPGDNKCADDEQPTHRVTITRGLWMGQTEVTVAAYQRFVSKKGRSMPPAPSFNANWSWQRRPIVNVTWDAAAGYCRWIGGRLPTEAEWEYAARAGSTDALYGPLVNIAWYWDNSGRATREVGQKLANKFGLYDMLGNVWEWVGDRHDGRYYAQSPSQDPAGPSSGLFRVVRGGSFLNFARVLRVSNREAHGPGTGVWYVHTGFRCVREVR